VSTARPEVTLAASVEDAGFLWDTDVMNSAVAPETSTTYAICAA